MSTSKKQIKFHLSENNQDKVRLAAALRRTTMADFCRDVVMQEAERLSEGIALPSESIHKQDG